jgi:integrase
MTLDQITPSLCREYAAWRHGQGRSNKGKGGGAKRDLEDLRAAINYHAEEELHRGLVRVVLPKYGKARQRWLDRQETAKLLWTCWRTREVQDGNLTAKHPLRHLCRFLLLGLYTGSRPGAVLTASWERGPGLSHVDLEQGLFHRHAEGKIETNKRQPAVKLAPRLAAHLSRWRRMDGNQGRVVKFGGIGVLSVKTALGRAVKLAGLPGGVTAYTMRHTTATWLVSRGVPIWDVAGYLGTSSAMIEQHYGHFAPGYQDRAAQEIGRHDEAVAGSVAGRRGRGRARAISY